MTPAVAGRHAAGAALGAVPRWDLAATLLVCGVLVAYDATRCGTLSITHDEALTYAWHVTGTIPDIIQFNTPGNPANNHMLLTLLAKASVFLFGDGEAALRLPTLLAYVLYCASAAAIIFRQLRGPPALLCLLFVTLSPYIVDMMSLARGYGLGVGLSTVGVWCLLQDSEAGQPRPAWWSGWAALCFGLAVLANLVFLPIAVAALGLMALRRLGDCRRGAIAPLRAIRGMVVPLLVPAALAPSMIGQIHILGPRGELREGGNTSFLADTVGSILVRNLYFVDAGRVGYALLVVFACSVPIAALVVGAARLLGLANATAARRDDRDLLIIATLLLGTALLSVLQHHLFDAAYLTGRRAISLYPLFGFACAGLLAAMLRWPARWRRTAGSILVLAELVMVVHFALAANLRMVLDWRYDSETKAMMSDLEGLLPRDGPQRYRLGITWLFEPAVNYYLRRNGWTSVAPVTRDGPIGAYDAYYVVDEDLPALRGAVPGLKVVRRYDTASATLAKGP